MCERIFGVATREQRDAKRQQWKDNRPGAVATMNKAEVLSALDGLDIAEKVMWACRVEQYMWPEGRFDATRWSIRWQEAVEATKAEALAEWANWQGEPE